LLLLMPVLLLAAPAFAEDAAFSLAGSVLVFAKFIRGSVAVDSMMMPATEISIHVACPPDLPCPGDDPVRIRAHWVCPGSQSLGSKLICKETGFEFTVPKNGTAVFNPDNIAIAGSNPVRVPAPPCARGFLVAWVIDGSSRPISLNRLSGKVTLRESGSALSDYLATGIPAVPPEGDPISPGPDGALIFDGGPGHYSELSSRVRQNHPFAQSPLLGPTPPGGFRTTFITLLTLDVRSNRPNLPTFVPFEFFDQEGRLISTSTDFVCWTEQRLDVLNENLTFEQMSSRWGLVSAGPAIKVQTALISDVPGPVTLLGLMEVREGPMAPIAMRTILFGLSPVHVLTPTSFLP
jgi:hypothetical protein